MRNFCTLFDSGFLPRGLVMYRSLLASGIEFKLAVFAFDDIAADVLESLALRHVVIIRLAEFEDPALLAVKPTRTRAEYCWTSTSSTILYCLQKLAWPEVTYLDADLYFFSSPEPLLREMGTASVLITSHNYAPAYDQSQLSGTYCVQFMRFVADSTGLLVAQWWRDRCLEWCFDRREGNKFGDQFYLEDWPTRFPGVHVLQHQGGGLAPWNISRYRIVEAPLGWGVAADGKSWPPVFYHFHGVRFFEGVTVGLDNYRLGKVVVNKIYRPYLGQLKIAIEQLQETFPEIDWIRARPKPSGWRAVAGRFKNQLCGTWNSLDWDRMAEGGADDGKGD